MKSKAVSTIFLDKKDQLLMISDVHWDNPHCDRKMLKADLDEAVKRNAKIVINGDLFCLMQGAYDPRKMKSDILPEHNNNKYLDSVINTAVDYFMPYKDHIKMVGYGNHETSIVKRHETDVIDRFVTLMNFHGADIQLGGYGGWIICAHKVTGGHSAYKIKYHHGFGGGGPVTKGVIQFARMSMAVQGADMIWMGHVHEDHDLTYQIEYLDLSNQIKQKKITMLRTGTYKEEYQDGTQGFHVMTGRPPKPLGGRWLHLEFKHYEKATDKRGAYEILTYTEPTNKV